MKLHNLKIERGYYGADKDKLRGEMTVENEQAKITLRLSEDQSHRIIEQIADILVENAQQLSTLLIADLQRPQAQIVGEGSTLDA